MTESASILTLASAADYVGAIVATHSFPDSVTGAHWRVAVDEDGSPNADTSLARVYTLDGAVWEVTAAGFGITGRQTGEIIHGDPAWDIGYQAGFADGANDAGAEFELEGNRRLLAAAESALAFAQRESTWGAGSIDANGRAAVIDSLSRAIAFANRGA